jgi:hypothetical protein
MDNTPKAAQRLGASYDQQQHYVRCGTGQFLLIGKWNFF